MRFCFPYILCVFGAFNGCAQDSAPIELPEMTVAGKTYAQVKISKNNDYEALVHHEGGIARIPLEILPKDLRDKLGYDMKKSDIAKQQVLKARRASLVGISKRIAQEEKARAQRDKLEKEESTDIPATAGDTDDAKYIIKKMENSYVSSEACSDAVLKYPDLEDINSKFFRRVANLIKKLTYKDMENDYTWPMICADAAYNQNSMGVTVSRRNRGDDDNKYFYKFCKKIAIEKRSQNQKNKK